MILKITFTISALLLPAAAKTHAFALLITENVRVILEDGGFGESFIGQTHRLVSSNKR